MSKFKLIIPHGFIKIDIADMIWFSIIIVEQVVAYTWIPLSLGSVLEVQTIDNHV